jgi:glycosyltransferase involved in cell wall biosynthesis
MKVSVVIPAYNEEKLLPLCLESLKRQTVRPDEVIVVDNNSVDKTAEIAKSYGATVIREKKQGMSFARNAGFDAAKYGIIARCDADSILRPEWIERIKNNFERKKIVALSGPGLFYDLGKNKTLKKIPKLVHTAVFFKSSRVILGHNILFGSNYALTKDVWLKAKNEVCIDDANVHEDMDMAVHLSKYGKICYDRKLVVEISARRVRQLKSYVDYPLRWYKTLKHGKKVKRVARKAKRAARKVSRAVKKAKKAAVKIAK